MASFRSPVTLVLNNRNVKDVGDALYVRSSFKVNVLASPILRALESPMYARAAYVFSVTG